MNDESMELSNIELNEGQTNYRLVEGTIASQKPTDHATEEKHSSGLEQTFSQNEKQRSKNSAEPTNNTTEVVFRKKELIHVGKLHQILQYTKKYDLEEHGKLCWYDECYPDRHKLTQDKYAKVPIRYLFSRDNQHTRVGRVYAYSSSFFRDSPSRFYSLQKIKRPYRAYLCEDLYWDLDIQNCHPSILLSLFCRYEVHPPDLLRYYVQNREDLLRRIMVLFDPEQKHVWKECSSAREAAKNLILRLMYGGTLQSWFRHHSLLYLSIANVLQYDEQIVQIWIESNCIDANFQNDIQKDERIQLLNSILNFPSQLRDQGTKLLLLPPFEDIRSLISFSSPTSLRPVQILSRVLQDIERKILLQAEGFLRKKPIERCFDVYIHDGGLIRRLPHEDCFPDSLLENLNTFIAEDYEFVKFVQKNFEIPEKLRASLMKEVPLHPEYNYYQWKYYLENHRDLCYITNDKTWLFADNLQTNMFSTFNQLRSGSSAYRLNADLIPSHLIASMFIPASEQPQHCKNNNKSLSLENEEDQQQAAKITTQVLFNNLLRNEAFEEEKTRTTADVYPQQSPPSLLDQSASDVASCYTLKRVRRHVNFVDAWQNDPLKREFCMIYFSPRTWDKDGAISHITPKEHSDKFDPDIRYIFQGWDLLERPLRNTASHEPFLTLLKALFPDPAAYEYVLNWIAHIFQYPDDRIVGTCLVLVSNRQGTGKTTLVDALLNLTKRYGKKIANSKEELFGNLTRALQNNVLLVIDDDNSSELKRNYEQLKSLITNDNARIRQMYHDDRFVITNARFVIVSNNPNILQLEKDSRRFAVFEAASTFQRDYDFFRFWNNEYWLDETNRVAVLHYLQSKHKIPEKWHPEESYPETNMKLRMECASLSILQTFIYSLSISSYFDKYRSNKQKEETYDLAFDIPSKKLIESIRAWSKIHYCGSPIKEELPNKNTLPSQLSQLGIENTKNLSQHRKVYRSAEHYRIPVTDLAKKALKFELDPLEKEFFPHLGHMITLTTASNPLNHNLIEDEAIVESESQKKVKKTTTEDGVVENIDGMSEIETAIKMKNWVKLYELGIVSKEFILHENTTLEMIDP